MGRKETRVQAKSSSQHGAPSERSVAAVEAAENSKTMGKAREAGADLARPLTRTRKMHLSELEPTWVTHRRRTPVWCSTKIRGQAGVTGALRDAGSMAS